MFNFNLENLRMYRVVKLWNNPLFNSTNFLKNLCFFISAFCFALYIFSFNLLGFFILFLSLGIWFVLLEAFFNIKLKNPLLKSDITQAFLNSEKYNLAQFLDFQTARAVYKAEKFAKTKNISVSSFVLLYFQGSNQLKVLITLWVSRCLLLPFPVLLEALSIFLPAWF